MISFYFGLPGCGKTSVLVSRIREFDQLIEKGRTKARYIFVNFPVQGFKHTIYFDFKDIGKMDFSDCYIVVDEGSVYCDNRSWKAFGSDKIAWFMLHRHYNVPEILIASQSYSGYDSKLRSITENVYYVFKRGIFSLWFTGYYRVPYGIIIPDRKDNAGEKFGEIVEGYCRPSFFQRLFCKKVFRPSVYKHFDSFYRPLNLPPNKYIIGKGSSGTSDFIQATEGTETEQKENSERSAEAPDTGSL